MVFFLRSTRLLTLALVLAPFCLLQAQSLTPISQLIRSSHHHALSAALFDAAAQVDEEAARFAIDAQYLTLDEAALQDLYFSRPENLSLSIPYRGQTLTLDLVAADIFTPDFKVTTSGAATVAAAAPGLHYRGIVRNDYRSLVAVSLFENEVMGLVSTNALGNLSLGRLENKENRSAYILYSDSEVLAPNPFLCGTEEAEVTLDEGPQLTNVNGCVRVFFEADYALFQNKGSVQNTLNYLSAVFNQVATLYANENISTRLSQVFVWVTPDFYSKTSSSQALTQFRTFRSGFDADLAHLVGIGGNNLGGIAYVNTLCTPGYNFAYSDINTTYNNVPTFSWTVEVLTHEMGHNLGSNHTHWCGWSGGALDNCFSPEGTCGPGPQPSNGGTIMSYCHLNATGINFNNGFGTQPGNLIRNKVGSASCLAASCTPAPACNPPAGFSVGNVTGNSATISWDNVNGANSYSLQWRVVGANGWNNVSNAVSPYTINNLPGNDEIEVRVQSVCNSGNSGYSNGIIFVSGVSACNPPGGLTVSAGVTSANVSWNAEAGAGSYNISWKTESSNAWSTPVNVSGTTYTISFLSQNTSYNVRVQSVCGNINSGYVTGSFTTGTNSACNMPTGLASSNVQSSSVIVSWNATSGALYYELQIRKSSSTVWTSFTNIPVTAVQITNLQSGTSYRVRVRARCSGSNNFSNWTPNIVFTTPSSMVPPNDEEPVVQSLGQVPQVFERNMPEESKNWGISAAPNPSQGMVLVSVQGAELQTFTAEIFDLYGKMLYRTNTLQADSFWQCDMSELPQGMYVLRVSDNTGDSKTFKIIRQ